MSHFHVHPRSLFLTLAHLPTHPTVQPSHVTTLTHPPSRVLPHLTQDDDFEELIERVWALPDDASVIFNCQVRCDAPVMCDRAMCDPSCVTCSLSVCARMGPPLLARPLLLLSVAASLPTMHPANCHQQLSNRPSQPRRRWGVAAPPPAWSSPPCCSCARLRRSPSSAAAGWTHAVSLSGFRLQGQGRAGSHAQPVWLLS